VGAGFVALLNDIRKLGHERAVRERECDRLVSQTVFLHPAGFGVLDPRLALAPSDIAERALQAIIAAIAGKPYPARREPVFRLRGMLAAADRRGHTLGGCQFIRWRNRVLVLRELASDARSVRLPPGASLLWDHRFDVALPPTAGGPVTI